MTAPIGWREALQEPSARALAAVCVLVLLLFSGALLLALRYMGPAASAPDPTAYPAIASYIVLGIHALLTANLTAYLGLSQTFVDWKAEPIAWIQKIAVWWYLVAMVYTIGLWFTEALSDDTTKVVAFVPQITKTFLGVFFAVLGAALGVKSGMRMLRIKHPQIT